MKQYTYTQKPWRQTAFILFIGVFFCHPNIYADSLFSFSHINPPNSTNQPSDGFNSGDTNVYIRPDGTLSVPVDFGIYDEFGSPTFPPSNGTAYGVVTISGYPQAFAFNISLTTTQSIYSTTANFDLASMDNAHTNTTLLNGFLSLLASGTSVTNATIDIIFHPHGRFFSFSSSNPPDPINQPSDGFNGGNTNIYLKPDGTASAPLTFGIYNDAGKLSPPQSNDTIYGVLTVLGPYIQTFVFAEPVTTNQSTYSTTVDFDLTASSNAHTNIVPLQAVLSTLSFDNYISNAQINLTFHPMRFFSFSPTNSPDAFNQPSDGFNEGDTNVYVAADGTAIANLNFGIFDIGGNLAPPHFSESIYGVLTISGPYSQTFAFTAPVTTTQSTYSTTVNFDLASAGNAHTNTAALSAILSTVTFSNLIDNASIQMRLIPLGAELPPLESGIYSNGPRILWQQALSNYWQIDHSTNLLDTNSWSQVASTNISVLNGKNILQLNSQTTNAAFYRLRYNGP